MIDRNEEEDEKDGYEEDGQQKGSDRSWQSGAEICLLILFPAVHRADHHIRFFNRHGEIREGSAGRTFGSEVMLCGGKEHWAKEKQ